jgi:hypothetical protein
MDYAFIDEMNEMQSMTWKEMILRAANQSAEFTLKNMHPLAKDPLFYGYLLALTTFCMISQCMLLLVGVATS